MGSRDATKRNKRQGLSHFSFKLGASKNSAFIMMSLGYMGLAPKSMQVGDEVCILPGCCILVVLHYAEECYSLVGECFALGLIDGEVLDGSDR